MVEPFSRSTDCVFHWLNFSSQQLLPQVAIGWRVSHEAIWAQQWVSVAGLSKLITPRRAPTKTPPSLRPSSILMARWLNSDAPSSPIIKGSANNRRTECRERTDQPGDSQINNLIIYMCTYMCLALGFVYLKWLQQKSNMLEILTLAPWECFNLFCLLDWFETDPQSDSTVNLGERFQKRFKNIIQCCSSFFFSDYKVKSIPFLALAAIWGWKIRSYA